MTKMTVQQARQAARDFIETIQAGGQWNLNTVAGCLPRGWNLSGIAEDSDLLPLTIGNVAAMYRRFAVRVGK